MKTPVTLRLLAIAIFAVSCGNDRSPSYNAIVQAEGTSDTSLTTASSASGEVNYEDKALSINDPSRKIIRTADLRCRVADVFAATTRMERLANTIGGQISESRMENQTEELRSLPYKSDSLKQVASYTTTAHLTLRIPVTMLDTVLSDIAANAIFIDSRSLHLDDVTLRYLGNKLKNDAMAANDAAQRARRLAKRSDDAVYSGAYTDDRDQTRIDRSIENMQLTDQVTYATLTLDLYQPQRITHTIVPDVEYLMQPTLGQQAGIALSNGWELLRGMLIGLLQIWPLVLMATAGYVLYRWRRGRCTVVRTVSVT